MVLPCNVSIELGMEEAKDQCNVKLCKGYCMICADHAESLSS